MTEKEEEKGSFLNKYNPVEKIGYAALAISTLVTSWLAIGNKFAQNLYENNVFEDIRKKRQKSYQELFDKPKDIKEFISGINQIEKDYKTARRDRLQQVGVKSSIDKWFALKHYQKWQIGLTIATILSLAVAVIISIKNDHKALKKEHKENIKEVTLVQSREEPVTEETSHDKQEKVIVGEKTRKIIDQPRDKISRA